MSTLNTEFASLDPDGECESDTVGPAANGVPQRIRILVADPDPLARRALTDSLREDPRFFVIGQAATGVEALELTRHYAPDLVLLASHLPGLDAVSVADRLARAATRTRVVMLATSPDLALEMRVMRAGASGFVVKSDDLDSICRSLAALSLSLIHI